LASAASAGGIGAFHAFFDHMPADCGMAFVMILHLPADRRSLLSGILSHWTPMPVIEAAPGDGDLIFAAIPAAVIGRRATSDSTQPNAPSVR
jgi:two-component system CheB/CheR fusion protein